MLILFCKSLNNDPAMIYPVDRSWSNMKKKPTVRQTCVMMVTLSQKHSGKESKTMWDFQKGNIPEATLQKNTIHLFRPTANHKPRKLV